jgi:hypothetical protein
MVGQPLQHEYVSPDVRDNAMNDLQPIVRMLKPGRCACLPDSATTHPDVEAQWRTRMVRECAYFRSLRHASHTGSQLEDWLAAEHEVDAYLNHAHD